MLQENTETLIANNSADSTSKTEVVEQSQAPQLSLDDLLDKHLSGPEFQQANHRGVDYNKVLQDLPSDAKKLIQNLRSDYSRKTTDLSKRKKELELRERSLLQESAHRLREAANLPEDIDLYEPDSLKRYIEAQAAKQLNTLLEPARKKMQRETRLEQVRRFQAENPDIENYKDSIASLIKERGLTIEDAYFQIKGKEFKAALEKKNQELEEYKRAVKSAGLKVSVGRPTTNAKPKFKNAYEVYQHMKNQGKA